MKRPLKIESVRFNNSFLYNDLVICHYLCMIRRFPDPPCFHPVRVQYRLGGIGAWPQNHGRRERFLVHPLPFVRRTDRRCTMPALTLPFHALSQIHGRISSGVPYGMTRQEGEVGRAHCGHPVSPHRDSTR